MNWNKLIWLGIIFCSCQNDKESIGGDQNKAELRPNILWLVTEDQSPNFFPFYGDSTATLPNLEWLAQNGEIFDNAYAPVPVCSPARSAIITGMYPSTLGTHNMRCYNSYQKHNQPEINVPSYSPIPPPGIKPFTEYLRKVGYYCTNNAKEDYNFRTLDGMWDESGNKANFKNRKEKEQPFFAVFNFNVTHESRLWQNGKKDLLVDADKVPVPPIFPDDPIIRHDLAVNYSNLMRMDSMVGTILDQLKKEKLLDNTYIFFYGDHGGPFPRYKRSVYDTGTKAPLVVKYPDGKNAGQRNTSLISFIDFAPTVLSLANIPAITNMQGKAFLGKEAREQPRQFLYTMSDRFDGVYDQKRTVRNSKYKYIRNSNPNLPYAIPVKYRLQIPMMNRLIDLNQKGQLEGAAAFWMANQKPKEELYDLAKDPYELNNLIGNSDLTMITDLLRKKLDRWQRATNDLGLIDEQDLIQRWNPDGKPPKCVTPVIKEMDGKYALSSKHNNESIIWKYEKEEAWTYYQSPIVKKPKEQLVVKSVRIGFEDATVEINATEQ